MEQTLSTKFQHLECYNLLPIEFIKACYICKDGQYLTEFNTCQETCTENYRFQSNRVCLKKCPGKYLYKQNCKNTELPPTYECRSTNKCKESEKDIGYYCLSDKEQTKKYQKCEERDSRQDKCNQLCLYCFGGKDNQCLGCQKNYFFSPYDTTCVKDCNNLKIFKYNNRETMVCEIECPPSYLTQELECVKSCKVGYAVYNNTVCLPQTQITDNFLMTYSDSYPSKTIFVDCPQICQTCTNQTFCTRCLNHYILNQNKCLITCYPQYLYIDEDDVGHCLTSCDPNDFVYDNANIEGYSIRQCFKNKCGSIQINQKQQTYLHQTKPLTCMYPCDDQYYFQQNTDQCSKCNSICQNCQNSANFCTKCWPGTFLQDNSCFTSCQSKFKNYMNNQCEGSCSSGFTINDSKIQACVSFCGEIFSNFTYVLNGQCYQNPPTTGAYCIRQWCQNCFYKCKTCSGPQSNQCLTCYDKTFLLNNQCVLDCGAKFYDLLNWKCVEVCPNNTYATSGYESINSDLKLGNFCSSTCLYNQFQYKGQCTDIQPENTFYIQKTNYRLCGKCTEACKTCFDSYSTTCSKCNPGFYLYNTTCSTECSDDIPYKDTLNNLCVVTCISYQENGYCVASCSDKYYRYDAQKQCNEFGCPKGTYNQVSTHNCYACAPGCATCTNGLSNSCNTCIEGYFLQGTSTCTNECNVDPDIFQDWITGKCVEQCPTGAYLQTLPSGSLACKVTCPIYYYSNVCVATCPPQTFSDGNICTSCAEPCTVCFGKQVNQCTKCDSGYYLADTTCVEVCPNTIPYANLANQTCVSTCPDFLYLAKKLCFSSCPGFLAIYQLNGKKECVDQCYYSKSYLSAGICLPCNSICKECYGPLNGNCLECESPYYLYQQKCQSACPSQLYTDLADKTCKESCPSTTVIQGQYCKPNCDINYSQYGQLCVAICPKFTYKLNSKCLLCNSLCRTCNGPLVSQCQSCIENYLLNSSTCTQTCPNLYDFETQKCVSTCGTKYELTDLKSCVTTCPKGYLKCNKNCLKTPPDGYYSDGVNCIQCNSRCAKCTSLNVCQACNKNNFLTLQTCASFCIDDIVAFLRIQKIHNKYIHVFEKISKQKIFPPYEQISLYGSNNIDLRYKMSTITLPLRIL